MEKSKPDERKIKTAKVSVVSCKNLVDVVMYMFSFLFRTTALSVRKMLIFNAHQTRRLGRNPFSLRNLTCT